MARYNDQQQLIVSPEWLLANLNNREITIVDCRFALKDAQWGEKEYARSHLPGALRMDLDRDLAAPASQPGGRHPLPDLNILVQKLANLGIEKGKTWVIAYDDAAFGLAAARFWWLLRYLGHDRVSLLDGGFSNWCLRGYPVTQEVSQPQPAQFTAQLRSELLVDSAAVKQRKDLPGVVLVDSREGDRYLGKFEPIDPIAGHIPGAINLPWREVCDQDGFCLSPEKQRQRWQLYEDAQEFIVYCGSGVTACVNLLSLELAGRRGKLYVGGWSEWCK